MGIPTNPEFLRKHFHKLELGLRRVGRIGEPQAIRNSLYMGIHNNRGNMENISQNQVSRLPSYTGKGGKRVNIFRNLASVLFDQNRCTSFDIFRFVMIEAGGMNILFQFR